MSAKTLGMSLTLGMISTNLSMLDRFKVELRGVAVLNLKKEDMKYNQPLTLPYLVVF